jgi:hypothetical protein
MAFIEVSDTSGVRHVINDNQIVEIRWKNGTHDRDILLTNGTMIFVDNHNGQSLTDKLTKLT